MGTHLSGAAVPRRAAKPLITAYALGLLSATSPRLLRVVFLLGARKLNVRAACLQIIGVLRQAIQPHRFPAFCGVLVGGSTLLQAPLSAIIELLLRLFSISQQPSTHLLCRRLARFIAALISASCSFCLLNKRPSRTQSQVQTAKSQPACHLDFIQPGPFDDPPEPVSLEVDDATLDAKSLFRTDLAGRTMDLTLFAVIRALDITISNIWDRCPPKLCSKLRWVPRAAPPTLFCLSAATIMHAWFYSPSRLPQTYNRWISAAAELDQRLVLALRHARYGTWVYGKETGMAPLLGSMCRDYGLPEVYGDPAKTIPVPCELVHMGKGKSCEKHALWRFWRGWIFAAKMYGPLQLIVLARHARKQRRPGQFLRLRLPTSLYLQSLVDMAHNSAFLGAFISFFYYGVCLSRTRLGPKVFSSQTVTPQMWDSGLCVLAGSLMCGLSIFLEQQRKRLEILLFVLPRAAATWFPRRYLPEHRWKEHLAFTLSAALVLTTAQENPRRVMGVLGNVLGRVMRMD